MQNSFALRNTILLFLLKKLVYLIKTKKLFIKIIEI